MNVRYVLSLTLTGLLIGTTHAAGTSATKIPVILDTDIGDDLDDALALALVLASPELDLRGVTTVTGDAHTRALIACRLLHLVGRMDVSVAAGGSARAAPVWDGQMQYGLRPAFRKRPEEDDAVTFLYKQLKARPGELTLLAVGPLTNIAELITKHPESKAWIKRLVIMGGAVRVGYEHKPPLEAEWNIKSDVKAARTVFRSGIPLVVAPLDATAHLKLEGEALRGLLEHGSVLTNQLHALYQLWGKPAPVLFDPLAVSLCFTERFCDLESLCLEIDDKGFTRSARGKPNARVATATKRDLFLKWYVDRLAKADAAYKAAQAVANVVQPVPRGNMPGRVHVIEDYETDIERRWWLCGKLETKNVPGGSQRACRGVLTNDFDDRMGDAKAIYTAVIFNPVPGPPMGRRTRLSFRCWLKGTDRLKVQLYTLSKGYHRHLTLTNGIQGEWQSLTVDMTQARRPDGSGGPLSEDERIDDIQFYTDPGAELIVDDIVLYEAAPADEKRPFPRPIFTAWFDTGKQGKEWPGEFDIVAKSKPHTWKAAKAVPRKDGAGPWIRLGLRGERPLGKATNLRFRYLVSDAQTLEVSLVNSKDKTIATHVLGDLKAGAWTEAVIECASVPRRTDEVHFVLPGRGELLIDDVLLYEPRR